MEGGRGGRGRKGEEEEEGEEERSMDRWRKEERMWMDASDS